MVRSTESERCLKMVGNLSKNLGESLTTFGYCVGSFRLGDTFSEILELEASLVVGKQLRRKYKTRRKRKGEKNIKTLASVSFSAVWLRLVFIFMLVLYCSLNLSIITRTIMNYLSAHTK